MKTTIYFTLIFIFISSIMLNIKLYQGYNKLEEKLNAKESTTFIWNDDLESVPGPNSLITLEMIENDTIYIGPYDKSAKIN